MSRDTVTAESELEYTWPTRNQVLEPRGAVDEAPLEVQPATIVPSRSRLIYH